MIRWRRLSILLGALLAILSMVAGCSALRARGDRDSRQNVFPDNYKPDLTAAMHAYLYDPTNIRDAYLTDPAIRDVDGRKRYTVCLRFNAKNSDGRYAGSRDIMAVFASGRFDSFIDQTNAAATPALATLLKEQCGMADYKPFPELQALTR